MHLGNNKQKQYTKHVQQRDHGFTIEKIDNLVFPRSRVDDYTK
jgi:hypothetical protein